jgi:hypothetical protein
VDLVRSLPISPQGFSYALTADDIFSKYLISIPLANKDTITVASGLTQIFTKHGVCNNISHLILHMLQDNDGYGYLGVYKVDDKLLPYKPM